MKKASKALFTICAIIGFILLMKWWDGPTEFSHLDWGISKETVKYELNLNEKAIVESDNFILSEVEFGMENEKRLYELYIFSGDNNQFYRGIYFSIPKEEGMLNFKAFLQAMKNAYGNPVYANSDSAEWENRTTIVKLRRGRLIHTADVRSKQISSFERADYLLSRALNEINQVNK